MQSRSNYFHILLFFISAIVVCVPEAQAMFRAKQPTSSMPFSWQPSGQQYSVSAGHEDITTETSDSSIYRPRISQGESASNMTDWRRLTKSVKKQAVPTPKVFLNDSTYKTELCRTFERDQYCGYGDKCQFAHGESDLKERQRNDKYKTELCRNFHGPKKSCRYGGRCHYLHGVQKHGSGVPASKCFTAEQSSKNQEALWGADLAAEFQKQLQITNPNSGRKASRNASRGNHTALLVENQRGYHHKYSTSRKATYWASKHSSPVDSPSSQLPVTDVQLYESALVPNDRFEESEMLKIRDLVDGWVKQSVEAGQVPMVFDAKSLNQIRSLSRFYHRKGEWSNALIMDAISTGATVLYYDINDVLIGGVSSVFLNDLRSEGDCHRFYVSSFLSACYGYFDKHFPMLGLAGVRNIFLRNVSPMSSSCDYENWALAHTIHSGITHRLSEWAKSNEYAVDMLIHNVNQQRSVLPDYYIDHYRQNISTLFWRLLYEPDSSGMHENYDGNSLLLKPSQGF